MENQNNKKQPGAIVWHRNELKIITNQNVGKDDVILNNLIKIKRSSIRLARVGDKVKYKDLSKLPERCASHRRMKIAYFMQNGNVGTNRDLYDSDSSWFSHFVRG